MFGALGEAIKLIEDAEIPVEGRALREALGVADRLWAKISVAVGDFDAEGWWQHDGAASMTAWLRHHGELANADAHRLASTARRLRGWPATRQAWLDGVLSGGQVRAICANVTDATADIYHRQEDRLVEALAGLSVGDTATAMRSWAARAEALVDSPEPAEPDRSLHLSRTLAGRGEMRGSFDAEAAELIATALRLVQSASRSDPSDGSGPSGDGEDEDAADAAGGAEGAEARAADTAATGVADAAGDPPDGPVRLAAQRRADALVDLCRWFLDHQHGHRGGRHRPHLNVVVDLDDLDRRHPGRSAHGTILGGETIRRLACDAGVHRVVTAGRSTILDYGRTTRVISPELWASLVVRDGGCRAPWCDRGPDWCEAHHVAHWVDGGPTDPTNLVMLCARHHHLLHQPGWHVKLLPDATVEVTDPGCRVHTGRPPHRAPPLPFARPEI